MHNTKKLTTAAVLTAAVTSLPAHASVDYSSITGAFSAADVVTGLLAIGAVFAAIFVALKGIRMVLAMMKGG